MTTATREHSISFMPHFAPKIKSGEKTQTRRVVRNLIDDFDHCDIMRVVATGEQFFRFSLSDGIATSTQDVDCPYGQPGDLLVPLTTWATVGNFDSLKPTGLPRNARIWTAFDGEKPDWAGKLRPGRFMPLCFRDALPRLEVTEMRVQRLQDISEDDAKAEGVGPGFVPCPHPKFPDMQSTRCVGYRPMFIRTWDTINGKRGFGWDVNPWVWAETFKMI